MASLESFSDLKKAQVQAFDDSKTGVKGILDSGITKIPSIFHVNLEQSTQNSPTDESSFTNIPIIDLQHIKRVELVDQIKNASKNWGFFQVINHGIPLHVLDEMINGISRFHEQDAEAKKPFYSRDKDKKVRYFSNGKLFRDMAANWRDTIAFAANPDLPNPEEIPAICR